MSANLDAHAEERLAAFARALINQSAAHDRITPTTRVRVLVWRRESLAIDGALYVVGRYRNAGDSRTGVHLGERGLELALFRSDDRGATFQQVLGFSKPDLDVGDRRVLSIEGSALCRSERGVELFVSTEKTNIDYPPPLEDFLKRGTGVWTIERLAADSIAGLADAPPRTVLESDDPRFMHYKDPFVYHKGDGRLTLLFCTHPYCWSSSNTALTVRESDDGDEAFGGLDRDFFPRGTTWDVAMTRATCVLDVPRVGAFADRQVSLVFYDGGECLRDLDEHSGAVRRPRGYSCEEIGGLAYVVDGRWREIRRLSRNEPWFISPHGSGCSRYVDVLATDGGYFASWQQSQDDLSQPLVISVLGHDEARRLLS